MNLWQAFKMAFRSIWGNKGRSALTMLGIIIGVAAVMAIVSIMQGMNKKSMEMYEAMGTNTIDVSAYYYNGMPVFEEVYDYCLQLGDLVTGITPQGNMPYSVISYGTKKTGGDTMGGGMMGGGMMVMEDSGPQYNFRVVLGSDQYALCNNFEIARGRDISRLDVDDYKTVCVLGSGAASYFFDLADPVGKDIIVDGVPFTVVGVYAQKDFMQPKEWSMDNVILFPYTAPRALGKNDTDLSSMVIRASNPGNIDIVTTKVTGFLAGLLGDPNNPNSTMRGEYWVYSSSNWQNQYKEAMLMMTLVLGGIAGISLLVGGIGIMNIMLVTVTERTKEIGVRRAIGARRKSIVTQFLIEAGVICGVGGVIGISLGTLITVVASQLMIKEMLLPSPVVTLGAALFSVSLGIIFGLYPAIKAAGLQPVVALRAE